MKTGALIAALATDSAPVDPSAAETHFYLKLAVGSASALIAVLVLMGIRPDWAEASVLPMFWMKLVLPAGVAAGALVGLRRLSYPGMRLGRVLALAALPVGAVWMMAGLALLATPAGQRLPLVLGRTWLECLVGISLLSVPAFAFAIWAARELAPTRLPLTGAAAGLFAGAAAAFAYAIHCPEAEAPFLAVWYVLGMAIPAGAGALLGHRLLHW